jgi:hypothetical protein
MKKLARWLLWALAALAILIVLLLGVLKLRPQLAVGIANAAQEAAAIEAPGLTVSFWPLSLRSPQVRITTETQDIDIADLNARLDPSAWWRDRAFWNVAIETLRVRQTGEPTPAESGPVALVDLRPYLTFETLKIGELAIEGDSPMQLSFTAEQSEDRIELTASANIPSHTLALEGTVTPTGRALETRLTFDVAPVDDAALRAQGTFEGTLETGERATLVVEAGDAVVLLGEDEHQLYLESGRIDAGPSAAIDELRVTDLTGRYENKRWSEPLPLAISGTVQSLNTRPAYDLDLRVHQTQVTTSGRYDPAASKLSGALKLESDGVHPDLPTAPFKPQQLFPISTSARYAVDAMLFAITEWVFKSPRNSWTGALSLGTTPTLSLQGAIDAEALFVPLVAGSDTAPGDTSAETTAAPSAEAPEDETAAQSERVAATEEGGPEVPRVFSATPVDWQWLDTAEVALTLNAAQLTLQDAQFEDLRIALNSTSTGMELAPLSAVFGGGGFNGSLKLERPTNQSEPGVRPTLAFELDGVAIEAFGLVPKEELTGGELEVLLALQSEGVSAADLASALGGRITFMAEDARLMNDFIELAGSDLVMETLSKLNPFVREDPSTELVCALAHFDVEEGVMTTSNNLVVETSKMEIVGNGTVDLGTEKIGLTLSPNAKSGIGINVGSLVKFLKLGGTLAQPRPTADAAGLLKSGAAIGAALSTGGVSILAEGLAKRALNAGSACARFRQQQEAPAAPLPAAP